MFQILIQLAITTIENDCPSWVLMLSGNFNRLDVSRLLIKSELKQVVNVFIRAGQSLD